MQVKRKGDDVLYHEIMHVSDPQFLLTHAQALANAILAGERSVLAIDRRFMPSAADLATETIPLPRWYRSPLARSQIDHLYGEIVLLDLKL
jgi:hypothetical protein